ncbi:VapE domain-containing protein [Peptostreptococcus porci]|uniref:phage NrS-1 polymerase family protein n=1 Tax=Peptostreptococcus porci TaxID=2652282 RepID=UPI002A91744F|nr:VapE domain-containing protein [Peptostreptococcus porci]MDY5435799.1 VapE family protein [Peptostreptococcus porci]
MTHNNIINKAKSNDQSTWTSFDNAIKLINNTYKETLYNKDTKKYDIMQDVPIHGLSMALTEPYIFIDLDHVINNKGETLPEALDIINTLNSYTEVSTSKTGYHILIKTSAPGVLNGNYPNRPLPNKSGWEQTEEKPPMIETFTNKRFMVFTSDVYRDKMSINDCTEILNIILEYVKPHTKSPYNGTDKARKPKEFKEYDGKDKKVKTKADDIIIQLGQLAKESNKTKFNKLFVNGDISDYEEDHSKADFGFCCMVAKYTKDTRVIDCVYKASALYTPQRAKKWDRLDYKQATIEKAIKSIQYNSSGLKVNDKGKILHTKDNTNIILNQMFIEMGYNVLTNEMEVINKPYTRGIDYLVNEVYSYCRSIDFNIKKSDLEDNIYFLAKDHMYNPFMDYILKCEAENKNCFGELEKLFNTLEFDIDLAPVEEYSKIEDFFKNMIRKWLISIVALNIQEDLNAKEGASVEGTLVLKGAQGIGKTTWLRNLVPHGYFKEGATLENNKDTKMEVYRYPLVELGELEHTTGRQETGFLKQELTRTSIEYRPPYAKSNIKFARHTIFCGSVNEDSFLKDTTGNRRFWVIPVKSIDLKANIDINKLWAEVTALYRLGVPWYLSKEERTLLDGLNTQYISISAVGMAIQNTFDFSKPKEEWVYISINSVYELIRHQFNNHVSAQTIGEQLRILGCEKSQRRTPISKNAKMVWSIPPLKFGYWNEKPLEIWREENNKLVPINTK